MFSRFVSTSFLLLLLLPFPRYAHRFAEISPKPQPRPAESGSRSDHNITDWLTPHHISPRYYPPCATDAATRKDNETTEENQGLLETITTGSVQSEQAEEIKEYSVVEAMATPQFWLLFLSFFIGVRITLPPKSPHSGPLSRLFTPTDGLLPSSFGLLPIWTRCKYGSVQQGFRLHPRSIAFAWAPLLR